MSDPSAICWMEQRSHPVFSLGVNFPTFLSPERPAMSLDLRAAAILLLVILVAVLVLIIANLLRRFSVFGGGRRGGGGTSYQLHYLPTTYEGMGANYQLQRLDLYGRRYYRSVWPPPLCHAEFVFIGWSFLVMSWIIFCLPCQLNKDA